MHIMPAHQVTCWWRVDAVTTDSCVNAEQYMRSDAISIMKYIKRRYAGSIASSYDVASLVNAHLAQ